MNELIQKYLSPRDAAAYLGIAVPTLRRFSGERKIASCKCGRSLKFLREDLDAFVLRREAIEFKDTIKQQKVEKKP